MARPKNPETVNLKQYATKVDPNLKATLEAIVKIKGKGFGQRELLEEMVGLYFEKHPEEKTKVETLLELLGGDFE